MAVVVGVVVEEGEQKIHLLAQPLGIAALLGDEGCVLGQHRLVHVLVRDLRRAIQVQVALDQDRDPAIHAAVAQEIEHAPLFVLQRVFRCRRIAAFHENLPQCDIGEPRIPVPQHVAVLIAAGHQERVGHVAAGLAKHAGVIRLNVLAQSLNMAC